MADRNTLLTKLRARAGLSQAAVARAAGLDSSTVNRIERRVKPPSVASLHRILRAVGATHEERSRVLAEVALPTSSAA